MEEEHLHGLWVVFDWFCEYNFKLKLTKREFFKSEINYLGHHISKDGVKPSLDNLEAIKECALPQTYTDIQAFFGFGRSP